MSSMRSASSSTTVRTASRCTLPRRMWSSSRPGVATMICGRARSTENCLSIRSPPYSVAMRTPFLDCVRRPSTREVWIASSRVGLRTSACADRLRASAICAIGMPNAQVLPVPVGACTMRSMPESIAGIVLCCTGVALSKPIESMAVWISGDSAAPANAVECSLLFINLLFPFAFALGTEKTPASS